MSAWVLSVLVTPDSAWAYVDPGTGSLILQLLLAGIAGIGVFLRMTWNRLRGRKPKKDDSPDSSTDTSGKKDS